MSNLTEDIKEIRQKYGLRNQDFADMFGYNSLKVFNNSARRPRLFKGLLEFEELVVRKTNEWNEKKSNASRRVGCSSPRGGGPEYVGEFRCGCGDRDWMVRYANSMERMSVTCNGCGAKYEI